MTTNVSAAEVGGLFRRHAAVLYRYCARRVGPANAEDVVADVFLIALRRRSALPTVEHGSLAWLYGIATNVLRRYRRDEIRAYRALARTGTDPYGGATEGPEERGPDRTDAAVVTRRLAACLAELPTRQREVLLLYAVAELSYAEIATTLDIPVGSVQSALHRARQRLRRHLADIVAHQPGGQS